MNRKQLLKKIASTVGSFSEELDEAARKNDFVAIKKLQNIINNFPWAELSMPKPNLPLSGKIDNQTQKAIDDLIKIGQDFNDPNILKMKDALDKQNYFEAQSHAYVAKNQLTNALHQFMKLPNELLEKYPGLRRWTEKEMREYLRNSPYPGYFPKPWSISRLGKRDLKGNWNCTGPKCQKSYYEDFMSWEKPGSTGVPIIYDPRLQRNMDKYPELFSRKAIQNRIKNNTISPHIPSPGTGTHLDINNLPEGKRFLDDEDKREYMKLLKLYNQFVQEEKERGSAYIPPPS